MGRGVAVLIKENSGVTCKTIYNDKEGKWSMKGKGSQIF